MKAEEMARLLKDRGMRLTAPRWAILRYLEGNDRHPSAQDVYEDLKRDHPGLSPATVYSTLGILEELGCIVALGPGTNGVRYDADPKPHVNLVCRECGEVLDMEEENLARLVEKAAERAGFAIAQVSIQAQGLCRSCAAALQEGVEEA
ncbi:MAG: Fur family transcriptional regulator [Bacillota bacterium]|nr:Fur family transcriptional regulator [Bacillota bacterium]